MRRRTSGATPSGLRKNSTGSFPDRSATPANFEDRKPELHSLAEMACTPARGCVCEAFSTTNAGRSALIEPSP